MASQSYSATWPSSHVTRKILRSGTIAQSAGRWKTSAIRLAAPFVAGGFVRFHVYYHSKKRRRSSGQKRSMTFPMMRSSGCAPKERESDEAWRLSPMAKNCPSGTVYG